MTITAVHHGDRASRTPRCPQAARAADLRHELVNVLFPVRADLEAARTLAMIPEVRQHVESVQKHVLQLQRLIDDLYHLMYSGNDGTPQRIEPDQAWSPPCKPTIPNSDRGDRLPIDAGIRVLCVDDHEMLVEGLRAKFAVEGRIRIVGSLKNAERLMEETRRLQPDIILLDVEMPGPDIFEVAGRLHHEHPGLRFAFLSAHVGDGVVAAAYKCGARGYFVKSDEIEGIIAGLSEIARNTAGPFVMSPKVRTHCFRTRAGAGGVWKDPKDEPATALASLSGRELEVLRLIGKGRSREQIASDLTRSVKTIDRHQERLSKKLGVKGRADLIRLAIHEGLAEA